MKAESITIKINIIFALHETMQKSNRFNTSWFFSKRASLFARFLSRVSATKSARRHTIFFNFLNQKHRHNALNSRLFVTTFTSLPISHHFSQFFKTCLDFLRRIKFLRICSCSAYFFAFLANYLLQQIMTLILCLPNSNTCTP